MLIIRKEGKVSKLDRSSNAIKKWLPLSLVGAAISLIIAIVFHVPVGRAVIAIALTVALIFSGFLLRSFRREERGEGSENEK